MPTSTTPRPPQLPDIVTYTAAGASDCRIRIWTVDGSVARDSRKVQDGGNLIDPDYIYQASTLGLSSGTNHVTLYVEGIRDSTQLGDTRIKLRGWPGSSASADACEDFVLTTVGSAMLLFDTDRDGVIRFGTDDAKDTSDYTHPDPADPDTTKYALDRTLNCRFWVNDSQDGGPWWHLTTSAKNPLTIWFEQYEDTEISIPANADDQHTNPGAGSPVPTNDSAQTLPCVRALENYSQEFIRLPVFINATNNSRYTVTVSSASGAEQAAVLFGCLAACSLTDRTFTTWVSQRGSSISCSAMA